MVYTPNSPDELWLSRPFEKSSAENQTLFYLLKQLYSCLLLQILMYDLPDEVVVGEYLVYEHNLTHLTTQQRVRIYLENKYRFIVGPFAKIK